MKHNKSILEPLLNNLARITCILVSFIIFGMITYRSLIDLSIFDGLSIFARQFYASTFQIIIISLILKYGLKKESKVVSEDRHKLELNIFDIMVFLFIGLLLKNILLLGLHYIEIITNTVPEFNSDIKIFLLEGIEVTKLDRIYSFMTGVILAPMVEELFFRKGVFKYYENKGVKSRTIILISGISFGLVHLAGFAKPVSSILSGITFATIYAITDNIMYPILGHGLNNWTSSIVVLYTGIDVFEAPKAYFAYDIIIEIKGAIVVCLLLLIITSIISYIKRKTIISSVFKKQLRKVLTE